MKLKQEIPMTEYQKLEKQYPKIELSKVYTPISDEEWKKKQDFQVPDFLKKR